MEWGAPLGPGPEIDPANGAEKLLVSLIDPNREVGPQYLLFTIIWPRATRRLWG
ncbi:MAG: hypothetical protein Ct9H300mP32_1730 [Verrucomicrobiota bacterium]|nr:MAG: hypothetical protein Ct9H300mP32_1730 [Verrucomicrobiota bacterium]